MRGQSPKGSERLLRQKVNIKAFAVSSGWWVEIPSRQWWTLCTQGFYSKAFSEDGKNAWGSSEFSLCEGFIMQAVTTLKMPSCGVIGCVCIYVYNLGWQMYETAVL